MENSITPRGAAEKAAFALRALYETYGYAHYRVRRFEEYDLYARNRSFITGSSILTFTDTDGRLMALKPDVTLSLIKNTDAARSLTKVYYNESVYRAPDPAAGFREIQQMGLECIGDLDLFTLCEVTDLAARSLAAISGDAILDVSHMGLLSGFLEDAAIPVEAREELLRLAEARNLHDLTRLCVAAGVPEASAETLRRLVSLRGKPEAAIEELCSLDLGPRAAHAVSELAGLARTLRGEEHIWLDLSLRGDTRYYNGVVLKGYLPGVPTPALSGGRYDGLVQRLGKPAGAMGFAVYLNLLDRWGEAPSQRVDTLILDDGSAPAETVFALARDCRAKGESVRVDRSEPAGLHFGRVLRVGKGGVQ